jgi:hypothetical protein
MSEQGWREFLTAEAVDGWVVLHGGATNADKPLRHAMHVDVSVARERAETRVAAALAPVAASTPTPLPAGSSQIAPATAFASPHGPTGPYPLLLLICSRAEVAMGIRCMRLPDLPMSVRMRDALPGGPWWQGTQSAQMSGSPGKHGISSLGGSGGLRSNRRSPRRRRRFLPGCCGRGRCECDSGQAS